MSDITARLRGDTDPWRLWTCGGIASELVTDVASPLCWSVWERQIELAYRTAMADFGILRRDEVVFPDDPSLQCVAVFYGRLAANVDATRDLMGRIPGVSANQFERDMFGGVREGVAEPPTALHRVPEIVMRTTRVMRRAVGEIEAAHTETHTWWQRDVLEPTLAGAPVASPAWDRFEGSRRRFADTLTAHIRVRLMLQSARGAFVRLAAKGGDRDLVGAVMGGYGGIADIVAADDLWKLGHGEIDLDAFMRQHGFRGPHEGNVFTRTWREQPDRVTAMAASLSRRTDAPRPRESERHALAKRIDAEAKLIRDVPAQWRTAMKWMLAKLERVVRANQLGRSTYLMCLDGCRAAARDIGQEQVKAGTLREVDDVFFFSVPELSALVNVGIPDAAALVAERRATRELYRSVRIPSSFTGMPSVIAVCDDSDTDDTVDDTETTLSAAAGSPGVVEGHARVVLDPGADLDLEPGDVLVCRATDPSWTSLMTLAAAIVIDNGGTTSHGAIVAREMGIPCVIGTGNATVLINDGDRIVVDGDRGTVTILERFRQPVPNVSA
jgi:phosphohistidine swiveling domain-containing protein